MCRSRASAKPTPRSQPSRESNWWQRGRAWRGWNDAPAGGLLTSIWESAEHIPEDIWIDYVVPQLVLAWMNGGPQYTPWTRDRAFYCTEGVLWVGDRQRLDTSLRIAGTNIFLVPKE